MQSGPITIFPIQLSGEIVRGQILGDEIVGALKDLVIKDNDVLVVTQKIVSKAEGRLVPAPQDDRDFRRALIESEAAHILRRREGLMITETTHGFICANAGIDYSNVAPGQACLLPADPDASARKIRSRVKVLTSANVAVIISDTFGRAWRTGQTNVAIGVAGMVPLKNYSGTSDHFGSVLHATNIAVADELAGAAELVMAKSDGIPVALIRGASFEGGRGSAKELIRPAQDDMFR